MRKIFINYRRDDRASIALNIAQYLERVFGADSIFLDIDPACAPESSFLWFSRSASPNAA